MQCWVGIRMYQCQSSYVWSVNRHTRIAIIDAGERFRAVLPLSNVDSLKLRLSNLTC